MSAFVATVINDPETMERFRKFEALSDAHKQAVRALVDRLYLQTVAVQASNVVQLRQAK